MRFHESTVIVIGAGSGFGEAIATRFAREGARVIAADIHDDNTRRVRFPEAEFLTGGCLPVNGERSIS